MKVVLASTMAHVEKLAFREGASPEKFMENAGYGVFQIVQSVILQLKQSKKVTIVCGKGNNAGDGYVAGRYLIEAGFEVVALALFPESACSSLCQINAQKFVNSGGTIYPVRALEELQLPQEGVLLDAILGTGFKGKLSDFLGGVIDRINVCSCFTIAIDIPSGVDGDTGEVLSTAVKANLTIFLGCPKMGMFLSEGRKYIQELVGFDFGLPKKYLENVLPSYEYVEHDKIIGPPPLPTCQHKYEAGYVVGIAGSALMPGAAILSSLSAIRSGAGIMRLFYPEAASVAMNSLPAEIVRQPFHAKNLSFLLEKELPRAKALFIGPGLVEEEAVLETLQALRKKIHCPVVVDASCLEKFAQSHLFFDVPCVLTPHQGELLKMLGMEKSYDLNEAFLQKIQKWVMERRYYLILKGKPTWIFSPNGQLEIYWGGDPGMATAGTGDVLTGIVSALLAQQMEGRHACLLAVHLHALAGKIAAQKSTSYAMIASDLIAALPEAFKQILARPFSVINHLTQD